MSSLKSRVWVSWIVLLLILGLRSGFQLSESAVILVSKNYSILRERKQVVFSQKQHRRCCILGRHRGGGSISSVVLPVQEGEKSTGTVCNGH